MGLSCTLSNGYRILTKTSGNQTLTQVFDKAGNIIRTRVKSVCKSTPLPQRRRTIGFHTSCPEQSNKTFFTITKNDYNYAKNEATASIKEIVYKNDEKICESILSTTSKDSPKAAIETLKHPKEWCKNTVHKVLRIFKGKEVNAENVYEFKGGLRMKRTRTNPALVNQIATETEILDKARMTLPELQANLSCTEKAIEELTQPCKELEQKISKYKACIKQLEENNTKVNTMSEQKIPKLNQFKGITIESPASELDEFKLLLMESHDEDKRTLGWVMMNTEELLDNLQKGRPFREGSVEKFIRGQIEHIERQVKYACLNLESARANLSITERKLESTRSSIAQNLEKLMGDKEKFSGEIAKLKSLIKESNTKLEGLKFQQSAETTEFVGRNISTKVNGIDFTL